jgi:midasin
MGKDNKFVFKRYMDDFPFEYYLIVKDVSELSGILADVLRQYFEQKW